MKYLKQAESERNLGQSYEEIRRKIQKIMEENLQ